MIVTLMQVVVVHVMMLLPYMVMLMLHPSMHCSHLPIAMVMVMMFREYKESTKREYDKREAQNAPFMSSYACKIQGFRANKTDGDETHHDGRGRGQHSNSGSKHGRQADRRRKHSEQHGHGTDAGRERGEQQQRDCSGAVNGWGVWWTGGQRGGKAGDRLGGGGIGWDFAAGTATTGDYVGVEIV